MLTFPHTAGRLASSPLASARRYGRAARAVLGTPSWPAAAGDFGSATGSRQTARSARLGGAARGSSLFFSGRRQGIWRREAWISTSRCLAAAADKGSRDDDDHDLSEHLGPPRPQPGQPGSPGFFGVPGIEEARVQQPPNAPQLRMLWLASALPFVGFGFLDNSLMILFGDFIDGTLCVYFSFSTMAAAAIGNTISDVAGIFSGGAVEQVAMRCGVEEPPMTREQKQMRVTRLWQYFGQCFGIVFGCTLGMCPLIWMDPEAAHKKKMEKQQQLLFQHVVDRVADIVHAEAAMLLFVDKEKGDLYTTNVTSNLHPTRWPRDFGFIGHSAMTGKFVNVADVHEEAMYDAKVHENFLGSGMTIKSLLCMPIWGEGEVIGMLVTINKREIESGTGAHESGTFTTRDEDVLAALGTHVAIARTESADNFDHILDGCVKSVTKQGNMQWNPATVERRKTLFDPMLKGMRNFLEAESCGLMLIDEENGALYTEVVEGRIPKYRGSYSECFAGWSCEHGRVLQKTADELRQEFPKSMRRNYQNSGIDIYSVLCVPVFDTGRKCLGAFEIVNKADNQEFSKDDAQYVEQVANYMSLMLEGPTAELRRVLALTRQLHQHKQAMETSGRERDAVVVCYLEQAQDLPSLGAKDDTLDSYVTFHIVRGDPLSGEDLNLQSRMLSKRSVTTRQSVWEIGKTRTIFENRSPKWQETLAVPLPKRCEGVPPEELFMHVLIWGYGSLGKDKVLAQASFPLSRMPRRAASGARAFPLHPVPGLELELEKARIWLSFSRDWGSEPVVSPDTSDTPLQELPGSSAAGDFVAV